MLWWMLFHVNMCGFFFLKRCTYVREKSIVHESFAHFWPKELPSALSSCMYVMCMLVIKKHKIWLYSLWIGILYAWAAFMERPIFMVNWNHERNGFMKICGIDFLVYVTFNHGFRIMWIYYKSWVACGIMGDL